MFSAECEDCFLGSDGLYYWTPTTDKHTYEEAMEICSADPQFRLGYYKTFQQMSAINDVMISNNWNDGKCKKL